LKADALHNPNPRLPETVKSLMRNAGIVMGTYKVCIALDGSVSAVEVMSGIAGADESIVSVLRGWRYKPQQLPVCTVIQFQFDIQ